MMARCRPAHRQAALEREYFRDLSVRRGLPHECLSWFDDPLIGRTLQVAAETALRKTFVARITGTDPKFQYAREFLGERRNVGFGVGVSRSMVWVPLSCLRQYDTLEIQVDDWRSFCLYRDGAVEAMSERELRFALASRWRAWVNVGGMVQGSRAIAME